MLKHILSGYRAEWDIEAVSLEEPARVKPLAERCDHFVVTHTSLDEVLALTGRTPDVVVNFQIDEHSIAFLNQRIHQIRKERMKQLRSQAGRPPATESPA